MKYKSCYAGGKNGGGWRGIARDGGEGLTAKSKKPIASSPPPDALPLLHPTSFSTFTVQSAMIQKLSISAIVMKYYFTIMFILSFVFSHAQLKTGTYLSYGPRAKGEQIIILPENHIQLIFGKDTLGGVGKKMNGALLAMKYTIDNSTTPNEIHIIVYDKNTGTALKTLKGLYRQVSEYSFDFAMNLKGSSSEKEINENNPNVIRMTLNCPENYINLLKLNDQKPIIGFTPETKVIESAKGTKEISCFQNGKLLNSKEFQTKEVCEYNQKGLLIKRSLYDIEGKPFVSELGFHKRVVTYNEKGQIETEQYFKNENELMIFTGKVFPQTKYYYNDNKLIQIERLVNNDSLRMIIPSTQKYVYDSYGDEIDWEMYFADGSKKIDTLKTKVISNIHRWISQFAKYPNSFQISLAGNPSMSWTQKGNEKVANSEHYEIYLEYFLNDSLNIQRNLTGFFQLDHDFNIQAFNYKTEKTGLNKNYSWSANDYEIWFSTFCRELTKEEIEKKAEEERKHAQDLLNTLDEAISGKNPDVKMVGDVDKKTLRKTRKTIKKSSKDLGR